VSHSSLEECAGDKGWRARNKAMDRRAWVEIVLLTLREEIMRIAELVAEK
jgi:hypothetical protein